MGNCFAGKIRKENNDNKVLTTKIIVSKNDEISNTLAHLNEINEQFNKMETNLNTYDIRVNNISNIKSVI